jgi:hypothetical protein
VHETAAENACDCDTKPSWSPLRDDEVLMWPVVETGDWEELRQCPHCERLWMVAWPEELEGGAILCRPRPDSAHRLREVDRPSTLRGYCLARLEEHLGEVKEVKSECVKVGCGRRRIRGTNVCIEHLIAQRFGRHLSALPPMDDEM